MLNGAVWVMVEHGSHLEHRIIESLRLENTTEVI